MYKTQKHIHILGLVFTGLFAVVILASLKNIMSKFIIAKTLTIQVENFQQSNDMQRIWPFPKKWFSKSALLPNNKPLIQLVVPMSYSLFDLIQIVRIYSEYDDTYDWSFMNPRDKDVVYSLKEDKEKLLKTRFDEFKNIAPNIICNYGPIQLSMAVRGFRKYKKVYPTIYQAVGRFPNEKEFIKSKSISDINTKFDDSYLHSFELKMKKHFKGKYKISDEIVDSFFGKENKLLHLGGC